MSGFLKNLRELGGRVADSVAQGVSQLAERANLDKLREKLDLDEGPGSSGPPARFPGELNMSLVTPRIIAMGFPSLPGMGVATRNPVPLVADYFRTKFGTGRVMVFNLSEKSYDPSLFDGQVVEHTFPGHAAPPLGTLFAIVHSIESWLAADARNAVAVHCMTGRGRTAAVVACAIAWLAQRPEPLPGTLPVPLPAPAPTLTREACVDARRMLDEVCRRRGSPSTEAHTQPSQRRYCTYFSSLLRGVRPHARALMLERVLIVGVPAIDRGTPASTPITWTSGGPGEPTPSTTAAPAPAPAAPAPASASASGASTSAEEAADRDTTGPVSPGDDAAEGAASFDSSAEASAASVTDATKASVASVGVPVRTRQPGFRPVLEVFKHGRLVWSSETSPSATPGSHTGAPGSAVPPFVAVSDGVARFAVGLPVRGDLLLRCRHLPVDEASGTECAPRVTVWRAGFHTGYVADNVLRLTKRQLDSASEDASYPADGIVEVVFAPVESLSSGEDGHGTSVGGLNEGESALKDAPMPPRRGRGVELLGDHSASQPVGPEDDSDSKVASAIERPTASATGAVALSAAGGAAASKGRSGLSSTAAQFAVELEDTQFWDEIDRRRHLADARREAAASAAASGPTASIAKPPSAPSGAGSSSSLSGASSGHPRASTSVTAAAAAAAAFSIDDDDSAPASRSSTRPSDTSNPLTTTSASASAAHVSADSELDALEALQRELELTVASTTTSTQRRGSSPSADEASTASAAAAQAAGTAHLTAAAPAAEEDADLAEFESFLVSMERSA